MHDNSNEKITKTLEPIDAVVVGERFGYDFCRQRIRYTNSCVKNEKTFVLFKKNVCLTTQRLYV